MSSSRGKAPPRTRRAHRPGYSSNARPPARRGSERCAFIGEIGRRGQRSNTSWQPELRAARVLNPQPDLIDFEQRSQRRIYCCITVYNIVRIDCLPTGSEWRKAQRAFRSPRCRCVGCLLDRSGPMTRLFAVPRSFACCLRRATDELARCPQHTAPTSPRRTLDCQPAPPILAPRHVHHHLRVRHRMHGRPQARHGCVHSPLCRYCARAAA